MAARAADRRRARSVEVAMETQVVLMDARTLDARDDAARARARTFLGGALDALRASDALDQLEDAKRERALTLVTELAGLLDQPTPPPSTAAAPLTAGKLPERSGVAVTA